MVIVTRSATRSLLQPSIILNTHLTGCHPSEIQDIWAHRWDFSHFSDTILRYLNKNPDKDIYLYASVMSCDNSGASTLQAPVFAAIVMPSTLGAPTHSVERYNNQAYQTNLSHFNDYGYGWKEAKGYGKRLKFLACSVDLTSLPEEKAFDLEYLRLYLVSPRDAFKDRNGLLAVDYVDYTFVDYDKEEVSAGWNIAEKPSINDHINEMIEDYYEYDVDEQGLDMDVERPVIKAYLKGIISEALNIKRANIESNHQTHFDAVRYQRRHATEINCFMIKPVNYPGTIQRRFPDKHVDSLLQQQKADALCVADHHCFSPNAGLRRRLLRNFNTIGCDEHGFLLRLCLLFDFMDATKYLDGLGSSIQTSSPFDQLISTFGDDRIAQYIGQDVNAFDRDQAEIVRRLVDEAKHVVASAGSNPSDASDFVLNYLFKSPESSPTIHIESKAEYVRLDPLDNRTLQVTFAGSEVFHPISTGNLRDIVSPDGLVGIILELLCSKVLGFQARVPAGARDEDEQEVDQEVDGGFGCTKGSILLAPGSLLSPSGKKRVEMCFPDYEISFAEIKRILDTNVRSVGIKKITGNNIHHIAMTAEEMMIVSFFCAQRKHNVFIDGSANDGAGTISDPVESYGRNLIRSDETLSELGITEFCELYKLVKVPLSNKTRKKLEKKLGLPFF